MVYKAQVIDNSNFTTTGKIRVRIYKYYFGNITDLSDNPEKILEGMYYTGNSELKHKDTEVSVFSPIGGGNDYGMFFLPQVNSEGIVLMLGDSSDSSNEFLWLGSIFEMKNKNINFPSDSMNTINGVENGVFNNEVLNGALIIKLRSTELKDVTNPQDSKNELNWSKNPIENLIVINKNKVLIEHSVLNGNKEIVGNSFVNMDENGININYLSDEVNGLIGLSNTGSFQLSSSNSSKKTTVSINGNEEGIEYISTNGKNTSIITQEHDNISLNCGGTAIGIKEDSITLKSTQDIYIDGANVRLGTDNLKVVLCSANVKTIDLSGGIVLTTSDTIYG